MNDNAQRLRALMDEHHLTRRRVAELLGLKLNSSGGQTNSRVNHWLAGSRNMPDAMLRLFELELQREKRKRR